MLENEFYPTPQTVVARMCREVSDLKRGARILDPSAGTGTILEKFHGDESWSKRYNCFAIEIDQDLRLTLIGKEITVIGSDFLTYTEPVKFDLVIMNPPFSNGAAHILKAWEYVEDGGQLVGLLNQETIENPFTKERQVLVNIIKENNGEIYDLGQCFKDSERPTSVSVYLLSMKKPRKNNKIDFTDVKFDVDQLETPEFLENPLAQNTPIKNLVARYKISEQIIIERYKNQLKLDFYLNDIAEIVYKSGDHDTSKSIQMVGSLETQIKVLKSRFWNTVFTRTKMGSQTTSLFQKKFSQFAVSQSNMAFSEDNIMEVLMMFFGNHEQIMSDCLVEVFDQATSYHEKNRIHTEGWKTNKSYKVGKRIIVPNGVTHEGKWGFSTNHYQRQFFDDLDKVICWLSGKSIKSIGSIYVQLAQKVAATRKGHNSPNGDYQQWFESEFFNIRIYKKGTVWLDFKDQQILDNFNRRAAEGKNWLGAGY
jgi:Domain of unknown function (DUF4942)/Methyltransferase small domain